MTTQSEEAPPEVLLLDPSPRSGSTAMAPVPSPAPAAPDPVEPMTLEQRVRTIAGRAGRGVAGVHAVGGGSGADGVDVQAGERETAIALDLVLDYGASVLTVSRTVRRTVIQAVEQGTGLTVTAVDVTVTDVHLPDGAREIGSLGGWPA